ncbi:hypothetical protein WISP_81852 [Willisornis vidua]|uniref:Uncharacterized protein n=1 Tax=Willisornis vidua TaxID=1566151 RepID=A0ABQ9D922_9PASS|nr:hypothetical protein WISP_81852 [Willisornis vidua]
MQDVARNFTWDKKTKSVLSSILIAYNAKQNTSELRILKVPIDLAEQIYTIVKIIPNIYYFFSPAIARPITGFVMTKEPFPIRSLDDRSRESQCPVLEDHDCENGQLPVNAEMVQDLLLQLDPCKSIGPDGILPRILKEQIIISRIINSLVFCTEWMKKDFNFIRHKNHMMVWVGKDPKGPLVPMDLPWIGTPTRQDRTPWKGPMLEQFVENCSLWEGLTFNKLVENSCTWEGPNTGAEEESEEEERAETVQPETPFPIPLHDSEGEGREIEREFNPRRREWFTDPLLHLLLAFYCIVRYLPTVSESNIIGDVDIDDEGFSLTFKILMPCAYPKEFTYLFACVILTLWLAAAFSLSYSTFLQGLLPLSSTWCHSRE